MIEQIRDQVQDLMSGNNDGHGFDHVQRVYELAMRIAQKESADVEIVSMAALLHDADDYKLFGEECAENLTNARKIMCDAGVSEEAQSKVCTIISNMGYSKALKGIRPQTLEGKIVSDADMLDAIGALGVVRTLAYALQRCNSGNDHIFDRTIFPELNLTAAEYKQPNRQSDNFVNHFFEKLLKLKDMLFTESARKEAESRHEIMVDFLRQFFIESNCPDWVDYLNDYEKRRRAA